MSNSNPVAIVTASTGIGAETAKKLIKEGWSIFVASQTQANVEYLVSELISLGGKAAGFAGDLSNENVPDSIIGACLNYFGRIDSLFNVAGISGRKYGDGPLHECSDAGWDRVLDINLTSQFRMCRSVVQYWLAHPDSDGYLRGSILNMSSVLGVDPEPKNFDTLAYGVSKAGIIGMSRILAAAYADNGIAVNVIAPGLVSTPMSARAVHDDVILSAIKGKQALSKGVIPIDAVSDLAAFMMTKGAMSMTGQVVYPDGGWRVS
ncbi:SDR family NAD(P)-dependent oxidoreductase [Aeromonas jandaei]